MSLLGKILAFLNLLGIAGLLFFASVTYSKRQAWQYAVFRHDIANHGLPLTKDDTNKSGEVIVELFSEQTLRELGLEPNKPPTQLAEVESFKTKLQPALQATEADKPKQLAVYARYLRPLAANSTQRDRLISMHVHLGDDTDGTKVKKLKDSMQEAIRPALEIMRAELPPALPPPSKRTFAEAYAEALHVKGGEPKGPFIAALLSVLPKGGKKLDQVFTDAIAAEKADMKKPLEEVFLQTARNEAGKPFADLFTAAFDEAIELLRADLKKQYDSAFDKVKADQNLTNRRDPEGWRQDIAHLLFNLVEVLPSSPLAEGKSLPPPLTDDPVYKRVLTVVGLKALGRELDNQAQVLQTMASDLGVSLTREQTAFVLAHQTRLEKLKDRASDVEVQKDFLDRKKEQVVEKEKILERRVVDVKHYEDELKAARQQTAEVIVEMRKMSEALYNIRLQIRSVTEENQKREKEIRWLEDRVR